MSGAGVDGVGGLCTGEGTREDGKQPKSSSEVLSPSLGELLEERVSLRKPPPESLLSLGGPSLGGPSLGEPSLGEPSLGKPLLRELSLGEPSPGKPPSRWPERASPWAMDMGFCKKTRICLFLDFQASVTFAQYHFKTPKPFSSPITYREISRRRHRHKSRTMTRQGR